MTAQAPSTRTESDSLGEFTLPADCLHGINTARGRENFAIYHRTLRDEAAFIRALAQVKKAAALANRDLGLLPEDTAKATIVAACDEILDGRHHEHFVIDMLEGSSGTSINMNANEVIANRRCRHRAIRSVPIGESIRTIISIWGSPRTTWFRALKLAVCQKLLPFQQELDGPPGALAAKSLEFSDVRACCLSRQARRRFASFSDRARHSWSCLPKSGSIRLLILPKQKPCRICRLSSIRLHVHE